MVENEAEPDIETEAEVHAKAVAAFAATNKSDRPKRVRKLRRIDLHTKFCRLAIGCQASRCCLAPRKLRDVCVGRESVSHQAQHLRM